MSGNLPKLQNYFNPLNIGLQEDGINSERYATLENCSCLLSDDDLTFLSQSTVTGSNTDKKCISVIHINARSLSRNIDAIIETLGSVRHKFTCVLVSETWLTDAKAVPHIPDYSFVGTNRTSKIGGGVGIYVLNGINFKARRDYCFCEETFESVFIEIICPGKNVLLGCIYRPPSPNFLNFQDAFEQCLNQSSNENKILIIGGDLNINLFKYDTSSTVSSFVNIMLAYGLVPTISRSTRITDQTETLIDNIFTYLQIQMYKYPLGLLSQIA